MKENVSRSSSEDEDMDSDSGLSEIDNEDTYFEKKVGYQRRALFRKNLTLQWRMKWTNLIQILFPIISLILVYIIKMMGVTIMESQGIDKMIYLPFPFVLGFDYRTIASIVGFFNVTNCNVWYMY